MESGAFKVSTVIGVGASLALHAGVATWMAVAPPSFAPSGSRANEVEIALGDFGPFGDEATPPAAETRPLPPDDPALRSVPPQAVPERPPEPPKPIEIEPEPIDLDKIILGIDESKAPKKTEAFLGAAEPTPHAAPLSEVEQPELTTKPAATPGPVGPLGEGAETTPAPDAKPTEEAEPKPADTLANEVPRETPSEAAPSPAAEPQPLGQPGPVAPLLPPTPEMEPNPEGDGRPKVPAKEIDPFSSFAFVTPGGGVIVLPRMKPNEVTGTPTPPVPSVPAAEATPKVVTPSPAGGGGEKSRPGEVAGKESSAFAIKKTQDFKPGRTLAPEGIEVTTFDPDIPVLSTITGTLKNPVIEMRFGPDGRVKEAKFKNGMDSGRKDWDEPILHAMHRWTIGGKKFKELLAENPSREVVMTIRMILTR
jgi:hypothetical protein